VKVRIGLNLLRVGFFREHNNELSGFVRTRKFIDQLSDCHLLMEDPVLRN
jgi:hypothetical protein